MFGVIRKAVGGLVSKVGEAFKKVGEWLSGKPARPVVVPHSERNRFLAPVRRAYAVAALFVFGLMVAMGNAWAAAAVDTGVQEAIDSFNLTFTAVKTVVLTILVFAVGYKLAKRWLKG